jgi:uncharacterized protein YjbI with pentapeptide repeats
MPISEKVDRAMEKLRKTAGSETRGEDQGEGKSRPRIDWRGADLRGVNLQDVNLEGADMRAVDARGVNFSRSNLRYADFRGAQVQQANFQRANLYGCKMQGIEAQMADFRGADMRQTNMSGAYIDGAIMPSVSTVKEELELALFGRKRPEVKHDEKTKEKGGIER